MLYILNTIGIAAIAAIGLNILIGYTGQISLGHGAFFGVGAYAAAILATRLGVGFYICHSGGGHHYRSGRHDFRHSVRPIERPLFDHRHTGRTVHHRICFDSVGESHQRHNGHYTSCAPDILGWHISGDKSFFFLIFISLVLMTWFAVNIMRSKYGRAFIAIRDNDRAAEGMGIPIFKYKLLSFAHQFFLCRFCRRSLGLLHGQHYDGAF